MPSITRRQACMAWLVPGGMAHALASAQVPNSAAQDKLKRLMEQVQPGVAGGRTAASQVSPQRLQERTALLARAEAALARLDVAAAEQAFDSAANILHAADTEMGLVRTYMQAGQYRRALAFGAHTAGAHLDVVGGAALYAWLLHIGGQATFAQRLLGEALARSPHHPLLVGVQRQLQSSAPLAIGSMLQTPVRLAPFGSRTGLPASARVRGSGLLVGGGRRVLAPTAALGTSAQLWVRNGLGQLAAARLHTRLPNAPLAVLQLEQALALDAPISLAPTDAFPGSVVYAVEYVASPDATARWPMLHTGFLGAALEGKPARQLGITLAPGARGGPVFDNAGRLIGIAMAQSNAPDQVLLSSALHPWVGEALGPTPQAAAAAPRQRLSADQIYESALHSTVQIIVVQ